MKDEELYGTPLSDEQPWETRMLSHPLLSEPTEMFVGFLTLNARVHTVALLCMREGGDGSVEVCPILGEEEVGPPLFNLTPSQVLQLLKTGEVEQIGSHGRAHLELHKKN